MIHSGHIVVCALRRPNADTAAIVSPALVGLRSIYRPGFKLCKVGVTLLDLQPDTCQQGELEDDADELTAAD